jgi:ATP-dependent helicase/nuclease subunit A
MTHKHHHLTPQQQRAILPHHSVWLEASAGSGKTKVLVDRLLALMLAGCDPERLLCLTFTKAAATEMLERIESKLALWARLADHELDLQIQHLGAHTSPEARTRARTLASVVAAGDPIKIQTLHSFCESLLRRFPLEASIPPYFTVLDDIQRTILLKRAQQEALDQLFAHDAHLRTIPTHLSQAGFEDLVHTLLAHPNIHTLLTHPLATLKRAVDAQLHSNAPTSPPTPERLKPPPGVLDALATSTDRAKRLGALFSETAPSASTWVDQLRQLTLTQTGAPRERLLPKALLTAHAEAHTWLKNVQEAVSAYNEHLKCLQVSQDTNALLTFVHKAAQLYQKHKAAQGALDYDDLILKTCDLLRDEAGEQWVLYKLDSALDHILVDEAQDTSAPQWHVIHGLLSAFFEINEPHKTLFVVGDPKQSIYSFQGASPHLFDSIGHVFEAQLNTLKRPFKRLALDMSFRSSPLILRFVDAVFRAHPFNENSIPLAHTPAAHHLHCGGAITLWPITRPDPDPDPKQNPEPAPEPPKQSPANNRAPNETDVSDSESAPPAWRAVTRLAHQIAHTIAHLITHERSYQTGHRLTPGDIMILLRKRGALQPILVRTLKALDIPVMGVDRFALTDSLAIQDILGVARVCLCPADDLALASTLKSPLFGVSEAQLMHLAYDRGTASLWEKLMHAQEPTLKRAANHFKALQQASRHQTPFQWFSDLLWQHKGAPQIAQQLGHDALETCETFLEIVLNFEGQHTANLQTFVAWLDSVPQDITRDAEGASNKVRVLTVHGSKGLEAPVVFLADANAPPKLHTPVLWTPHTPHADGPDNTACPQTLPLWIRGTKERPQSLDPLVTLHQNAVLQEDRRLLYVALTRARERLIVAGWSESQKSAPEQKQSPEHAPSPKMPENQSLPQENCTPSQQARDTGDFDAPANTWYHTIAHTLETLGARKEPLPAPKNWPRGGHALSLVERAMQQPSPAEPEHAPRATPRPATAPLPSWLTAPCNDAEAPHITTVTQSARASDALSAACITESKQEHEEVKETTNKAAEHAQLRGQLVHKLLEHLPSLPVHVRSRSAQQFAAEFVHHLGETLTTQAIQEALLLLEDTQLAWIWQLPGCAEVDLCHTTTQGDTPHTFKGRVDRLLMCDDTLVVLDFKTGRQTTPVPDAYRTQMQLYRQALEALPQHQRASATATAVVWTRTRALTWIHPPPPHVMQHIAQVCAHEQHSPTTRTTSSVSAGKSV